MSHQPYGGVTLDQVFRRCDACGFMNRIAATTSGGSSTPSLADHFSAVTMTNADFEAGALTGWTYSATGVAITSTAAEVHGGSYAVKITNSTDTPFLVRQAVTVTPEHFYKFKFWALASGGTGRGEGLCSIRDATHSVFLFFRVPVSTTEDEYTEITTRVAQAPVGCTSLELRAYAPWGTGATICLDDFSCTECDIGGGQVAIPTVVSGCHFCGSPEWRNGGKLGDMRRARRRV